MRPKKPHRPPADLHAVPCCACAGLHRLVDCDDLRGADLLAAADLPMTAHKVRVRALAKGGAA
ncbi:MAG: hypothetical protein KBD62_37460 [Kofleriaceae bacterium]|nr:hypothetical protein [Kofleriaceae bacterium]